MDGDAVEAEPSEDISISEFFIRMFPYYMNMGMSYNEYWHGPAWLVKAYREAYETRLKNEEWARHRQGMYYLQALKVALSGFNKDKSKSEKYPEEPWPMTEKEAKEQEKRKEERNFKEFLSQLEAESERNLKKRKENAKQKEAVKDGDD